jgi:hypothetical protein
MPRETEQIACPKYPDHGVVIKRWLAPEERELIRPREGAEVYEIDCPHCGKFEYQEYARHEVGAVVLD